MATRQVEHVLHHVRAVLAQQGVQQDSDRELLRVAAGVLLAASLVGGLGLAVGVQQAAVGDRPSAEQSRPKTESPVLKTDAFGDPLPQGALIRVGTIRFRHAEGVTCSVFSPDGKTVFSASYDGTVRQWDVATGKELRRFVGHRGWVRQLALSADGTLLASGGEGPSADEPAVIWIWDVSTAKERGRLNGPKEAVSSLAWAPDNKTLAAGERDGTVRLWDAVAARELQRFTGHKSEVGCLAFSRDGKRLASTAFHQDPTIRLLDLAGGREPLVLSAQEKYFHFVAFSRDGKTMISGGDCYEDKILAKGQRYINTIAVWDAATGKRLREFRVGDDQERPHEGATSVALSSDSKTLALGYSDHTIRLWDLESGKPLRKLTGFRDRFYPAKHLAFSPDGRVLSACGSHHALCLLDTATGKSLFDDGLAQKSNIRSVALSRDGKLLATASHDYTVNLWDTVTGKPLHQLRGHQGWVYTVAFAPDGRTVASGSSDGTVRLWDVAAGKEVRKLEVEDTTSVKRVRLQVSRVAFSPDSTMLAASYDPPGDVGGPLPNREDGIWLWDPATGKQLRRLKSPSLISGGTLAFAADGKSLLVVGGDKTIRRWNIATGEEISKQTLPLQWLPMAALSSDGLLAVTDDYDQEGQAWLVQVWNAASGRLLKTIRREGGRGHQAAFSPDSRYFALCDASYGGLDKGENLAIELWELASGKMVRKLPLPPHVGVSSTAFAADSRKLATGMSDTTALIWDLRSRPSSKNALRLEDNWAALAGDDAVTAYQAIAALIDSAGTTAFLKRHLQPAAKPDAKRLEKLLADLDSDEFSVREDAVQELEKLGDSAAETYRKALDQQPSPERRRRIERLLSRLEGHTVSGEELRGVRAIQVLEHIATPEARQLLKKLATGASDARLTREAKAALARLAQNPQH
jgi:WD40 repeat protein